MTTFTPLYICYIGLLIHFEFIIDFLLNFFIGICLCIIHNFSCSIFIFLIILELFTLASNMLSIIILILLLLLLYKLTWSMLSTNLIMNFLLRIIILTLFLSFLVYLLLANLVFIKLRLKSFIYYYYNFVYISNWNSTNSYDSGTLYESILTFFNNSYFFNDS